MESPPTGALSSGNGETILIIDDEEPVRTIARTILESHGYRVFDAGDGRSGLELYRQHHAQVKVVITDIMMPSMQGTEVITNLRTINPETRIVAMSGMINKLDELREEPGRLLFLQKPMTSSQLIRAIQDLMDATPNRIRGT